MNFDPTEEQEMMRESFARLFDAKCTPERLRETEAKNGWDPDLWLELAELGAFILRVPEEHDGLGLGTFDVCVLMEEVGRKLPFGPIAETVLGARLVAMLGDNAELLGKLRVACVRFRWHRTTSQPSRSNLLPMAGNLRW